MDQEKFIPFLKELAEKYSIAGGIRVELEQGSVKIDCDKGSFRFIYHFAQSLPQDGYTNIPLFHWRNKRRYIELRNILDQKLIETPLAMRIHHIVPKDEFTQTLADILVMEADLAEFITRKRIKRAFADFSDEIYTNCILAAESGIKISMELGLSRPGSEPVLLHEVIAKTGIASDVAVDTQMQQYPVYVIKGEKTQTFTDIDEELYGLENTQADTIRFILDVLAKPEAIPQLQADQEHLLGVYQAAANSSASVTYTKVGD